MAVGSALSWQLRRTAVVAVAVLLSSTAMGPIFASIWGWLLPVLGAVATVALFAMLARLTRVPLVLQPFVMALGLVLYALIGLVRTGNLFGVIPTGETLDALAALAQAGFNDIMTQSTPVLPSTGLSMLTAIGVGLVAIVADAMAVGMRRPALAGLPMLAMYAIPVSVTGAGLPWPLFVAGAVGYLWLISTDHRDRIRGWGRMMRPTRASGGPEPSSTPIGAAGRRIGLIGIGVAVVLPLAIPALPVSNLAGLVGGNGFGAGGAEVSLINPIAELKGQLNQPTNAELLRVRTNDANPLFLRLVTLDAFRPDKGWEFAFPENAFARNNRIANGVPAPDIDQTIPKRSITTSVQTTGLSKSNFLPIYPNPTAISADGDWRYDRPSGTVLRQDRGVTGKQTYKFTSVRVPFDPPTLRTAPELPASHPLMRRYASVPPLSRIASHNKYVSDLVAKVIKGKKNDYDKARALKDYFSGGNGFIYDLQTKNGNTGSDLVDFLQNKRGFCEQYAAAMTYLARVAGMPARVAVGFNPGLQSNGVYKVRAKDAHAWVEIYFSGLGWVPFDPTPDDPNSSRPELPWSEAEQAGEPGQGGAPEAEPTPSASAAAGGSSKNEQQDRENAGAGGVTDDEGGIPPALLWWSAAILVALIILVLPALARVRTRRKRLATVRAGPPTAAAHAGWDEILDTATDLQFPLDVSETPRATAERLRTDGQLDGAGATAIGLLAGAEERARYAPVAAPTPGLLEATIAVTRQLRRTVRARHRWQATLAPASALARVSERTAGWSESTAERTWRLRQRLTRILRRS